MKKILKLEQQIKEFEAVCIALAGAGLENTDVYKLAILRHIELKYDLQMYKKSNGVTNEIPN